jgi:hypothetical protein
MSSVIAERDWRAIRGAKATIRAQDQNLFTSECGRFPPHPGVLCEPKQVSRRLIEEHFLCKGERTFGPARVRVRLENRVVTGIDYVVEVEDRITSCWNAG